MRLDKMLGIKYPFIQGGMANMQQENLQLQLVMQVDWGLLELVE